MVVALPEETFWHRGQRWHRIPEQPYQRFVMGVDLGQSQDSTAIAVIDHTRTPLDDWDANETTGNIKQKFDEHFDVRHLQRLPLGMSYPEQVARVRELLARSPLSHHDVDVCLDQTGCGAPVGDLVEAAGLKPVRITFTAGHEPIGAGRKWGVPKSIIVSGIDAKLHCGALRFSKQLLEGDALKDEMQNFQRSVSQTGKLLFEHRAGKHDDLIFSIGISLWWAIERRKYRTRTYGALGMY